MNRPASLKKKILLPMLIIIIITPILTLVVFNLTMTRYTQKVAVDDLRSIVVMLRDREALLSRLTDKKQTLIGSISTIVRANRNNSDMGFALLDSNYQKIEIDRFKSDITDELVQFLNPHLKRMKEAKIRIEKFNNTRYVFTYLSIGNMKLSPKVLLTSSTNVADSLIRMVNGIILAIAVITLVVGLLLTHRLNKGVVMPMSRLCTYSQQIGQSNFIDIPVDSNITEIEQLSRQMADMSLQLKKSTESQNKLMQNISHEIRTPLMSIRSYAEGLKTGVFTDIDHATSIICEECNRLNTLVNQLLLLSSIENQNYASELEEINLSNAILEYLQSLRGIALKQQKQLNLIRNQNDIIIQANDTLLTQIIYNIVTNGLRYARSEVNISLTKAMDKAILKIADNGPGFNEKDIHHIFERFYKGEKGKFGLGLAIAKSAAEFMGGNITIENGSVGAIFTVSLPLVKKI